MNGRPFEIIVALLTPFGRNGEIDHAAARAHVSELVSAGVDGLLLGGTTGEGPLLDVDELTALIETTKDEVGDRASVIAQVGRPSTRATIRGLRQAVGAGADAVAVVAPYYYAFTDGELLSHFNATLTAAGSTPLFIYNIPSRTVNDIDATVVAELALRGAAGIKDSTKSWDRHVTYLTIREAVPSFRVLTGSDTMVLQARNAGSNGVVSALANVQPELLIQLRNGSVGEVERCQGQLHQLRSALRRDGALRGLKLEVRRRIPIYPAHMRSPLDEHLAQSEAPGGPRHLDG